MAEFPIHLAVEDQLSEFVARRILGSRAPHEYYIGVVYASGGFGYLKKRARAFNNAAKGCPFLLLTDQDDYPCAPALLAEWLNCPKNDDFLLRVAVKEVESWLLGDRAGIAAYLGVPAGQISAAPELLQDPKAALLAVAAGSPRRKLREAMVVEEEGHLKQGPDYNGSLGPFVFDQWNIATAAASCPSLQRCINSLAALEARRAA